MAIFAPVIRASIKVEQEQQIVRVNVAGPGLGGLVGMLVPMLNQFLPQDDIEALK